MLRRGLLSLRQPMLHQSAVISVRNYYGPILARHVPSKATSQVAALLRPRFAPRSAYRFYSPITLDLPAKDIEFKAVKEIANSDHPDIVLLDVREPDEYQAGHIPGAINVPFKTSPGALGLDSEEFLDNFGFEKPDPKKQLVFYCLGGVRSTAAEGLAATYGYQNRANYKGSWEDWVANNGEVEV